MEIVALAASASALTSGRSCRRRPHRRAPPPPIPGLPGFSPSAVPPPFSAWSSGIFIAAAAAADVSHSTPISRPEEPRVPTEHLSLVRMADYFTWTFLIRLAFRVLELEIKIAVKADRVMIDDDVLVSILEQLGGAHKFGKLGDMFICKEQETS